MGKIERMKYADRAEWLAIRNRYIGGSDAGAVVGLNPYMSPIQLWMEKTGKTPPFEGSLTTKVGAYLEDLVAKIFTEETGKKVHKVNATMINSDYPWACANIDRAVEGESSLLEIKTSTSLPVAKQVNGIGKPMDYHLAQVIHYMAVTGYEHAYIAYLLGNREFRVIEVQRDESEIAALMQMEQEFWQMVQDGVMPSPTGAEGDDEALSTLYPEGNDGEAIDLFGYEGEIAEYIELKAQINRLTEMQDAIAQRIKRDMGTATRGTCGGYKVLWSNSTSSSLDKKSLEVAHPGLLAQYTTVKPKRMFTIKEA